MTDFDCIVIGAGVIGLAVARSLARDGRPVMILESERQFAGFGRCRRRDYKLNSVPIDTAL